MNRINFINVRTLTSAAAAALITVTVTMAISWMFLDTAKVARAHYDSVSAVIPMSALVR